MGNWPPLIQDAIDEYELEQWSSRCRLTEVEFQNNEKPLPIGIQFQIPTTPDVFYVIFGIVPMKSETNGLSELNYLLKASECESDLRNPTKGYLLPIFVPHSILIDYISAEFDEFGVKPEIMDSSQPKSERIFD